MLGHCSMHHCTVRLLLLRHCCYCLGCCFTAAPALLCRCMLLAERPLTSTRPMPYCRIPARLQFAYNGLTCQRLPLASLSTRILTTRSLTAMASHASTCVCPAFPLAV